MVSPSIVSIGTNLRTCFVVDRNNIALQILFEEVAVIHLNGIVAIPILQTDRCARRRIADGVVRAKVEERLISHHTKTPNFYSAFAAFR